jgi:hypothetical protein
VPQLSADAFYTGLVAELYTSLKSTSFDPDHFHELISRHGEPALELGSGDGDPLSAPWPHHQWWRQPVSSSSSSYQSRPVRREEHQRWCLTPA